MMAESDFTRGRSNTSSVCTALWSGPASGTRQLRYSLDVPGWFCERVSPTRPPAPPAEARMASGVASCASPRRSLEYGRRVRGDFRRDQFAFDQSVKHGLTFRGCGRLEFLDRTGEQVQFFAQLDMFELQVACGRRQIVRGDGCQRILAVVGRIGIRIAGVGESSTRANHSTVQPSRPCSVSTVRT